MLLFALSIVLLAYYFVTTRVLRSFPERLFVQVFTVSTIYYGILGPWYWAEFKDSTYIGVNWGDYFPLVVFTFVMVFLIVIGTITILGARRERINFSDATGISLRMDASINSFIYVGLFACLYVFVVGGGLAERGALMTEDAFLLIFFALADVLIGVLLFVGVTKGFDKKWYFIAITFVLFSVIAGFRSKIILLLGPLLLYIYFKPSRNQRSIRLVMLMAGLLLVALFSIMTIARVKFSGLDFDTLLDAGWDEYLYGVFAETNIIFGLISCLKTFGESVPFAWFDPFTDVIVQFVPRFLYPEKHLYLHLYQMGMGLGNSQEALDAGTAPPFFGEYYAAFGWFGIVILVVVYAVVALSLMKFIRTYAVTKDQYMMGAALIAVFVAYYYFSRGSIAQISKGLIFACGPYFYLLKLHAKNIAEDLVIKTTKRVSHKRIAKNKSGNPQNENHK